MRELLKKVAYLQGLTDGMELEDSKEGKVINGILEVLEDMAEYLHSLTEQQNDLEDYLEPVDSDLGDVEEVVFEEEDYEDEDEDYVDVECPTCHEVVCFDRSILYDEDPIEVVCPNCEGVVFSNDEDFEVEEGPSEEEEK